MYKYTVNHIPYSQLRRPNIKITPEYLTIHSTANLKSTAKNERDWLTNPSNNNQASFHLVVDENEVIECIPLNEVAWHAGDGRGKGNMASISIEICESGDREKTLQNAIQLVAKLLYERKWGIDRVKQHYDWSGKNCPRILRDTGRWLEFIKNVENELNRLNNPTHWAEKYWNYLNDIGVKIYDKRYDDAMTRGEVFALLARIKGFKE
ncbi:peptidoglycan recognition protein family protein [Clostridium thermosuccinogenes]|uniref:peptidoglycan recognition protein family protein n=1 Tax=Clostridium thermosuccinogenes TaxID=84032 RepID=UPI000CCC9561|nr:N-acetylmuramoyl-L-alanine amidase [Pseudoclostridium thermosuccinogenes]PNT94136.1 hypothetical protein CDQ83_11855 [Pseudoclostridium thermosuccinogenes]